MEPMPSRPASRREPIFNVPLAVVACIGVLLAAHGARSFLSAEADFQLLLQFAFIPGQWTVAWDPSRLAEALRQAALNGPAAEAPARAALARFILSQPKPGLWSVLTYALLHGSWAHVLLNSVWLATFGTPVARRCGSARFVALGLAAAAGGAVAHGVAHPLSAAPMIGASAAVSGMMAAAARFMFAPASERHGFDHPHLGPRQSLPDLVGNRRAALFIGLWFATNLLFGIAAAPLGIVDASIAWEAHIGGFLVGLLLFPLLDPDRPVDP
jgi:membrane associated rhomboid family serine protease